MNLFTLSSCDLLRYDGGSLGLTKYEDGSMGGAGEITSFLGLIEDPALEAGRKAATAAFVLGLIFLPMLTIHNFGAFSIPYNDILLSLIGAGIQLCLLVVYTAKDNGICEVEDCSWGSGATWLLMSEMMLLAASAGSLYTSETLWIKSQLSGSAHSFRIIPHRRELISDY